MVETSFERSRIEHSWIENNQAERLVVLEKSFLDEAAEGNSRK